MGDSDWRCLLFFIISVIDFVSSFISTVGLKKIDRGSLGVCHCTFISRLHFSLISTRFVDCLSDRFLPSICHWIGLGWAARWFLWSLLDSYRGLPNLRRLLLILFGQHSEWPPFAVEFGSHSFLNVSHRHISTDTASHQPRQINEGCWFHWIWSILWVISSMYQLLKRRYILTDARFMEANWQRFVHFVVIVGSLTVCRFCCGFGLVCHCATFLMIIFRQISRAAGLELRGLLFSLIPSIFWLGLSFLCPHLHSDLIFNFNDWFVISLQVDADCTELVVSMILSDILTDLFDFLSIWICFDCVPFLMVIFWKMPRYAVKLSRSFHWFVGYSDWFSRFSVDLDWI